MTSCALHLPTFLNKATMEWQCPCGAYRISHMLMTLHGWSRILGLR